MDRVATATSRSPPDRTAAWDPISPDSNCVAVEEWHRRIPEYAIAEGAEVEFHVGGVAGVDNFPLVWYVG